MNFNLKVFFLSLFSTLTLNGAAFASEMTISGAASLTNAFNELKEIFAKNHPGLTIQTNYAASNPLLRQIEAGAPVDVFATADQATMDKAEAANLINRNTRRNFAVNDLVLIVPKGAEKPAGLNGLEKFKRIAIGNPDSVPAGRYAREALSTAGLYDKLAKHYIKGESVRQVLDYVARGEVDAGFVYRTDAELMKDRVDIVMMVDGHDPISYPVAVAVTGKNPKAGQEFLDFVLSPEGQEVLARYGFSKPRDLTR